MPCGWPRGPTARSRSTLDDGRTLDGLGAVVLAQGHLPAVADPEQRRLADYAAGHGLRYLPPANPADLSAALEALAPGRPVLLRGLGLNFFDHMALLTTARGGRFVRGGDGSLTLSAVRTRTPAVRGLPARHPVPRAR